MVSWEETAGKKQFFWGKHIPKNQIKKSFRPYYMPDYYGIGIVQPFYFNIKQMVNILGVAAVAISLLQLYVHISRANYPVFEENIKFQDTKDKELVSKSFELKGGSAPLKVEMSSAVDNSWASTEIGLVNEKTNEITTISQDLEYYHGVEDGESWSEGSGAKTVNFCGVPPGKYHFIISAEKEKSTVILTGSDPNVLSSSGNTVTFKPDGMVEVFDPKTGNILTYGDIQTYEKDLANAQDVEKIKRDQDSILGVSDPQVRIEEPVFVEVNPDNQSIHLTTTWLPVSLWNYGIIIALMAVFTGISYWGKYAFEKSKWSNSNNSPYPES
jgi:hypothetical protein